MIIFKIIGESIRQAFQQLVGNKLRSFLSLLGITIGIWCVITVLSAVDSLEYSIINSFEELGNDVIYVSKRPWGEDPDENRWKYKKRKNPGYNEYKALKKNVKSAKSVSYSAFVGSRNLEFGSYNITGAVVLGVTYDFAEMYSLDFASGRYFSPAEYQYGANQIVIGHKITETLFPPGMDPVGKKIKILGRRMQVIGVLEKEGKDLVNPLNFDDVVFMPYSSAQNFVNTKRNRGGLLNVKAKSGIGLDQLKDDITSVLRSFHRLQPKQKDDFSLNNISILTNFLSNIFGALWVVGLVIAGFSILVGGFGVANIMFVSVKERTSMIGIKKALGAKNFIILTEFLIESVILCLLGGFIGLALVFLMAKAATNAMDFEFFVSAKNIIFGVGTSVVIGIVAGILPAISASRMDPVEAIRS